ncbi:MAG: FprA family A-type flavoprotein [Treponemataceae bacterium]|nr:MAG: FprA family A-type flavoprotein [Treponemataceae bacterium]
MDTHTATIGEIDSGIFCLHADLKTTALFEGLWDTSKHGVSLNAYVVRGEKTALIDLCAAGSEAASQLKNTLASSCSLTFADIDYVVLNHMESDHTGFLRDFCRENTKAQIICTEKAAKLVHAFYGDAFYGIDGNSKVRVVKDGDTLDLGGGKKCSFYEIPNVHWPETMVTFEESSGTLFSCDAFGSYGALGDKVFDDEYTAAEHALFEDECLRYYASIVASFSLFVEKAIAKLTDSGLASRIKCIAPSHGIVWRKNPLTIIERYKKYAAYGTQKGAACESEIAIIWGSMYGNTRKAVDAVIAGIEAAHGAYTLHQIPDENYSYPLACAFKSKALVLAMPTYEYAMFPPMAHFLDICKRKHIGAKKVFRLGSWGWSGGAKREYETAVADFPDWTHFEGYEWNGAPTEDDLSALKEKATEFALSIQ